MKSIKSTSIDIFNTKKFVKKQESLALDGLKLVKIGSSLSYYEKIPPQELCFQVDILGEDEEVSDLKERYAEQGFDFIGIASDRYIFSRNAALISVLKTNTIEKSKVILSASKRMLKGALFSLAMPLFVIIMLFFSPIELLLAANGYPVLICFFLFLFGFILLVCNINFYRKVKYHYKENSETEFSENSGVLSHLSLLISLLSLILAVVGINSDVNENEYRTFIDAYYESQIFTSN